MQMPFYDWPTFWSWVFSNSLWNVLAASVEGLMVTSIVMLAALFGFKATIKKSFWVGLSVFVAFTLAISAIRPSSPTPRLIPRILQTSFGRDSTGNDITIIIADVRNAGLMTSSVININAYAIVNGIEHKGNTQILADTLNLNYGPGSKISYNSKEDSLYNKVADKIDVG